MEYTIPKIPTKAPVQITEKELIETLTIINVLSKELLEKVSRIPSEKSTSHRSGGKHYGNRNPYKKM